MAFLDELEAHYVSVAGAGPQFHAMESRQGGSIGVYEWAGSTSTMGVDFYASAGITSPERFAGSADQGVEVFLGVIQGSPHVLEAFANMARSIVESNTVPRHGVFVAGDWTIIKGRKFTGWVLTERADDLVPALHLEDGRHVFFLDACPVYPEEAEFRHGNRADELLEIWTKCGVQSWDLNRELPKPLQPLPRRIWHTLSAHTNLHKDSTKYTP